MSNDNPKADALLTTERERCLTPVGKPGPACGILEVDDSVSCLHKFQRKINFFYSIILLL